MLEGLDDGPGVEGDFDRFLWHGIVGKFRWLGDRVADFEMEDRDGILEVVVVICMELGFGCS